MNRTVTLNPAPGSWSASNARAFATGIGKVTHDVPAIWSGQRPHELSSECWCHPSVTISLVRHNVEAPVTSEEDAS